MSVRAKKLRPVESFLLKRRGPIEQPICSLMNNFKLISSEEPCAPNYSIDWSRKTTYLKSNRSTSIIYNSQILSENLSCSRNVDKIPNSALKTKIQVPILPRLRSEMLQKFREKSDLLRKKFPFIS